MDTSVKRGDIYYADLSPVVGSEQGGVRPVLIIQNDTGNRYSPTVIAAAITSQTGKAKLPTHIDLPVDHSCGLSRDSVVLLEQVRTLDKKRLRETMGHVEENVMERSASDCPTTRWFERSVSSAIHRPGAAAEAVSWPPGNAWFDRRVLLKRAFRPFQGYRFFRSDNQYGGT